MSLAENNANQHSLIVVWLGFWVGLKCWQHHAYLSCELLLLMLLCGKIGQAGSTAPSLDVKSVYKYISLVLFIIIIKPNFIFHTPLPGNPRV